MNFFDNKIGYKGTKEITNYINQNNTLISLNLGCFFNFNLLGNNINFEGIKELSNCLKKNNTLKKLDLTCI
jgi:hypothetical protein